MQNEIICLHMEPYDGSPQGRDLFCRLFRAYRGGKARQSGKWKGLESGTRIAVSYRLTKHDFRWEKCSGSLLLEESAPEDYGWSLTVRSLGGDVVSKTRYSPEYRWLQTAYYQNGDTRRPALYLRPAPGGMELLRWNDSGAVYEKVLLVPTQIPEGGLASLVNADAGEPVLTAFTTGGQLGYCPREQAERRARALEEERDRPFAVSLVPAEGEDALDAFQAVPNLPPPQPPKEPAVALAEEILPPREKKPAPPPPSADYAMNRELQDFPEEPALAKGAEPLPEPGPVECIRLDDAENARATEALLAEAIAHRGGAGARGGGSARYSVAARDRKGVVRAPGLGGAGPAPAAAPPEPPAAAAGPEEPAPPKAPLRLPNPGAVKQIVVSAGESYLYFGQLQDGQRTGRGRTQMQNGSTAYEGQYKEDRRDGFGVYYYKSGKLCYAGNWKQNMREGAGVAFSSRDGSLFAGKWKDNVPTGLGAAFDPEGNLVYTGEWKDGKRHGHGTEYKDGKILFTGEWEAGRPVKGFRHIDRR